MPSSSDYDAIVIGSGAGGGFAVLGLTQAGLRVLVIERGRQYDFRTDYPMNHPDWELRRKPFVSARVFSTDYVSPMDIALDPDWVDLQSRNYSRESGPPRTTRMPFHYQRAIGLGGSTLHYQGEAHRFADFAFRSRSRYRLGTDWPISYRDLEPYYARAEQVLGVAGEPGNPFKPARGMFPTPAHPLSRASQRVKRGADALGWRLLPNTLALPSRSVDGRSPCQWSGGCVVGCKFGAKSSTDLSALAMAGRTGRLAIMTDAQALRLETENGGRVSGVVYRHAGVEHRASGRVYVLALGAVETPRLLLNSSSSRWPHGLANGSGQVGRYFMETVIVRLNVRYDAPLDPYIGPPIDSRIWDFALPRADGAAPSGFVLGVSGTMSGYHGPVSYALRTPGIGRAHKQTMREQFGTVLTIFGIAEHEPRFDNRVELEAATGDGRIGSPSRASIRSSLSDADCHTLREMIMRCEQLADVSGGEKINRQSTYERPAASHVGGTCRMGTDPDNSVVDPFGRCHEVPNVFIADGSVLVTQGAGDSPSLTIQSLALRTADLIAELMQRREL